MEDNGNKCLKWIFRWNHFYTRSTSQNWGPIWYIRITKTWKYKFLHMFGRNSHYFYPFQICSPLCEKGAAWNIGDHLNHGVYIDFTLPGFRSAGNGKMIITNRHSFTYHMKLWKPWFLKEDIKNQNYINPGQFLNK